MHTNKISPESNAKDIADIILAQSDKLKTSQTRAPKPFTPGDIPSLETIGALLTLCQSWQVTDIQTITETKCNGQEAPPFDPKPRVNFDQAAFDTIFEACRDSSTYTDNFMNNCQWYSQYDIGCTVIATTKVKENCPVTCGTCANSYVEALYSVFDTKRWVCEDTGWELEGDNYLTYAEAAVFKKYYQITTGKWDEQVYKGVLLGFGVNDVHRNNLLLNKDDFKGTLGLEFITKFITTASLSYATHPMNETDSQRVLRLTGPLETPTQVTFNQEDFEEGMTISVAAWVRNFAGQSFFQISTEDGEVCVDMGPRDIGPYQRSTLAYQPFSLRYGMYRYRDLLKKNATAYWELFTKDYSSGYSFYKEKRDLDKSYKYPRHYPAQIVLETVDSKVNWINDNEWHHLCVVFSYDSTTFYVDGTQSSVSTYGDQLTMLPPDLCNERYDINKYNTSIALIEEHIEKMDTLGLLHNRILINEPTEQTQEEGIEAALPDIGQRGGGDDGGVPGGDDGGGPAEKQDPPGRRLVENTKKKMNLGVATQPLYDPLKAEVLGLEVYFRGLTLQEVQGDYYKGVESGYKKFTGRLEDPPKKQDLGVNLYVRETVSVMPPLILQSRGQLSTCDGGEVFANNLQMHIAKQFTRKCHASYTCSFPSFLQVAANNTESVVNGTANSTNVGCVDRSIEDTSDYWDSTFVEIGAMTLVPEVVYMFDSAVVYREGEIRAVKEWIDLKTVHIVLMNIFYTPGKKIATKLNIQFTFEEKGPSLKSSSITSVQMMSTYNYNIYIVCCVLVIILASIHILYGCSKFCLTISKDKDTGRFTRNTLFKDPVTLILFDFIHRGTLVAYTCAFLIWRLSLQNAFLGEHFNSLIEVPWTDKEYTFKTKFAMFFEYVEVILQDFQYQEFFRICAFILVFLGIIRTSVFMTAHPRIALLINTIVTALDDLIHFFISFMVIYVLSAFLGFFMYGDTVQGFKTIGSAIFTQFQMLIGDWPWQEDSEDPLMYLYFTAFALIVFFILLNFFLAIIIDAYSEVKGKVEESEVENSLAYDIYVNIYFSFLSCRKRWPNGIRERVLRAIMSQNDSKYITKRDLIDVSDCFNSKNINNKIFLFKKI
eukprot:GHVR01092136.1.p1 GENE.GHVR01092136.1~~GHVR01092136.1.p1  ORF type:complete len:1256 (-),score=260.69 GHVR01092136.1:98-3418(-)